MAGTALALLTGIPLAGKWQLGMVRASGFMLAVAMLAAVVLTVAGRWLHLTTVTGTVVMWAATVLVSAAGLLAVFFRDPGRPDPQRTDVIVSPADGRVVYVRAVPAGQAPVADKKGRTCPLPELARTWLSEAGAVAVGISMNLSDVHVNRAPIGGRVQSVHRTPGTFGSLRNPEMLLANERVTTVIDGDDPDLQVAVVQIASRLVRRIVAFIGPGDAVRAGQRIGAIRFGSQVDLLVPARPGIRLAVQAGDRVVAGQTAMAVIVGDLAAAPGNSAPAGRKLDGRRLAP